MLKVRTYYWDSISGCFDRDRDRGRAYSRVLTSRERSSKDPEGEKLASCKTEHSLFVIRLRQRSAVARV